MFYQSNWEVVDTVSKLIEDGIFPDGICDSLLVTIPKTDAPERPSQFRPISLLNVVFKLATKVIVNRLKGFISSLVSPMQSSFIPGRQITNNVVIMQEVIHSLQARSPRKWLMVLKIDLEKAYDRIRWEFLRETLILARFPDHLVDIILKCQSVGSTKLIWNGGVSGSFKASRGIRQGDPLSPYLFVLCMERLSHIISDEVEAGHWNPIVVGGVSLSHLFFADDLMLFAEA